MAKRDPVHEHFSATGFLYGGNAAFIEELYANYLRSPGSVDPRWAQYFAGLQRGANGPECDHEAVKSALRQLPPQRTAAAAEPAGDSQKQVAVLQLINAYRFRGHQQADLDPLGLQTREEIPELQLEYYQLEEADLGTVFSTGSLTGPARATLRDIIATLRETYCGHVGAEYMHITDTAQKRWIQQRLENGHARPQFDADTRKRILERITAAEGLEQYLHTKYVGQKRFSLEGGESLIPLLDEVIHRAGGARVREVVMGMAHRGRLNVLVNIMGKDAKELFEEFEGRCDSTTRACGDVKYHQGFSSDVATPGGPVHVVLAFNPSHLEIINPVVEGSVRARQDRRGDSHGEQVLPVLIHGDAAFAGQGVVMETFNMALARGYTTRGTVHIIINNQIGFTTSNPLDMRSTLYSSEVARIVQAPIFHVNGDDPEAVMFVTQLALDFRMTFKRDVVIDLVCYRRHGHSEADEPTVTQPVMYKAIRQHPTLRALYAEKLVKEGAVSAGEADAMLKSYYAALDEGRSGAVGLLRGIKNEFAVDWRPYLSGRWDDPADTAVPMPRLQALSAAVAAVPADFKLHPRVSKILDERARMGRGELPLDWGAAETLAYATLLDEGYPVRVSGQDSGRGTFFHRHAVLHHQESGECHVPLQHVSERQALFAVIDSPLSEEAVLGFEYGYATASPESLVIWEAQFGDFANNAQVLFDQFISSGEVKWGRLCGLVMFLPHGYDGQGPEHSSARPERFLQLCVADNMQVIVPTTPAQVFHMLRRQMLRNYRKPLVVMSPKSLLRHKLATSPLADLAEGRFQAVLGELDPLAPRAVRKVILCTGKVYFDLVEARRARSITDTAIVRIEQLNPFPADDLKRVLAPYKRAKEWLWCQEEPANQGAYRFIEVACRDLLPPLRYVGLPPYAAPAEGFLTKHLEQQAALVDEALGGANMPKAGTRK